MLNNINNSISMNNPIKNETELIKQQIEKVIENEQNDNKDLQTNETGEIKYTLEAI